MVFIFVMTNDICFVFLSPMILSGLHFPVAALPTLAVLIQLQWKTSDLRTRSFKLELYLSLNCKDSFCSKHWCIPHMRCNKNSGNWQFWTVMMLCCSFCLIWCSCNTCKPFLSLAVRWCWIVRKCKTCMHVPIQPFVNGWEIFENKIHFSKVFCLVHKLWKCVVLDLIYTVLSF